MSKIFLSLLWLKKVLAMRKVIHTKALKTDKANVGVYSNWA